jgi:hypothetical protein
MKVEDAIWHINKHREKLNLQPVSLNERPYSKDPSKTTVEILIGGTVASKSISWGPIAAFLKGMLMAFEEKPSAANTFKIESPYRGKRKINWR